MKEEFDFYSKTVLKSYNLDEKIRYQLKMLDGLDVFTRKHSENVANITCRLCEYLRMSEGFTVYCTTCAYLHDIGKIFIPPSVLQKPGKLTDEEYEIIKTHTTIGYDMCMKDVKLRPYAAGPYYHHEALNGTGYPQGLKAKDIPYEAQIIRVADEFDAISSKRQYKTHVGIVDTLNILIENAQPNQPTLSEGLKQMSESVRLGKIDKKIVKALFKVIADDTEYEISCRLYYIDYLKQEIKRLEKAKKYYDKMEASNSESKKDYFRQYSEAYLKKTENVDLVPQIYQELNDALVLKQEHVDKLYDELKKIKHLKV